jgi:hypothetical protein
MLRRLVRRIAGDAVIQMAAAALIGGCAVGLLDVIPSPSEMRLPSRAALTYPGRLAAGSVVRRTHPDPAVRRARLLPDRDLAGVPRAMKYRLPGVSPPWGRAVGARGPLGRDHPRTYPAP